MWMPLAAVYACDLYEKQNKELMTKTINEIIECSRQLQDKPKIDFINPDDAELSVRVLKAVKQAGHDLVRMMDTVGSVERINERLDRLNEKLDRLTNQCAQAVLVFPSKDDGTVPAAGCNNHIPAASLSKDGTVSGVDQTVGIANIHASENARLRGTRPPAAKLPPKSRTPKPPAAAS